VACVCAFQKTLPGVFLPIKSEEFECPLCCKSQVHEVILLAIFLPQWGTGSMLYRQKIIAKQLILGGNPILEEKPVRNTYPSGHGGNGSGKFFCFGFGFGFRQLLECHYYGRMATISHGPSVRHSHARWASGEGTDS